MFLDRKTMLCPLNARKDRKDCLLAEFQNANRENRPASFPTRKRIGEEYILRSFAADYTSRVTTASVLHSALCFRSQLSTRDQGRGIPSLIKTLILTDKCI